jgi:uncharacterized membrane protein
VFPAVFADVPPLRRAALVVLALSYVGVGVAHFTHTDMFVAIVPPALPAPRVLVWISEIAEVALGLAVLVPRVRPWAGWGLLALLIAVFPANIYMAVSEVGLPGLEPPPRWALWARLPFQLVFAAWALWATDALSLLPSRRRRVQESPP